ncbi:MAG: sulfite exporter TauE/SafE family protein [Actinomycetota bacterium]|nr:sulfite exporter TauE/SafE family protein [Actinomycetota bacterium]
MHVSELGYLGAAAAAVASGAVNAVAGGGTLISFPSLVAIGVAPVPANITNTVSLLPGYLAGTWGQREDLRPQIEASRTLSLVAAVGGLSGSVLLVVVPAQVFRAVVPFLILISCALMVAQDRLRQMLSTPPAHTGGERTSPSQGTHRRMLNATVFVAAMYGGFFGAGLGIMLLAVLGVFLHGPLVRLNALKQALSLVVNLIAAVLFCFSGRVVWPVVPVMALGSLCGGYAGSRTVSRINEKVLRTLVVFAGVAVAISFWVT